MTNFSKLYTGKPTNADLANVEIIADRIDNIESALSGGTSLTTIDINGGIIDGCPIGINTICSVVSDCMVASTTTTTTISVETNIVFQSQLVIYSGAIGTAAFYKNFTIGSNLVCSATITVASDIICSGIVNCPSGIGTDSNEMIKFDVLSFTTTPGSSAHQEVLIPHGKSTNIRGASAVYEDGLGSYTYRPMMSIDSTNVRFILQLTGSPIMAGTGYVLVAYV